MSGDNDIRLQHQYRLRPVHIEAGDRSRWGCRYTRSVRSRLIRLIAVCFALAALAGSLRAADALGWSRFRGPNGSGVSSATNVPIEFGPAKNLIWRLALPRGHS